MLVVAIAGEHLTSSQLIPDNASPHHYSLKPSDIKKLHQARLIFRIDEDLEGFLNQPLQQLEQKTPVISLAEQQGIKLITLNEQAAADHQHHRHHDLHIWLDPDNAIAMAQIISKQLSRIDPQHKQDYQNNLAQLVENIKNKDAELKKKLMPIQNKAFLVFHNAWGYFESHYGLKNVTVVSRNTINQLGISKIQKTRQLIKNNHIECLLIDPNSKTDIVDTLTSGSSAKVTQSKILGEGIPLNINSYINLIESIADGFLNCN